jgi:hypothetical protein
MTRTWSRLLAALILAGVIAACGGGDDGSDDAVASLDEGAAGDGDEADDGGGGGRRGMSSEEQAEFEDAMLEYAQCMRDHGVDMPDPEFNGEGGVMIGGGPGTGPAPDSDEFEEADEACQPIIEDARPDAEPMDPEQQAELQDQLTAMAECMREHGHDMPDPQVSDGGRVEMRVGGPDSGPPDEDFEQDLEECHEEVGLEGPAGARRSTSGGGEA